MSSRISKPDKADNMFARIAIGAFVAGLVGLIVWAIVDLSGLFPSDSAVLSSDAPKMVLPNG